MKEKLKDRYNIIAIILTLSFITVTLQLVNIQVINGKAYDEQSQRSLLRERKVEAPRGNIVDRYGVPIAVNRQGFTVSIVKTKMKADEFNDMLLKLVNIFEKNNDSFYKSLNRYLTFNPIDYGASIKGSESKIEKWKGEMAQKTKDIELMTNPQEVFEYFRKKFGINDKYTDQDAYKIMTLNYEMLIRYSSSLNPLLLAKDVSKETIAEIEERHAEFPGVTTDIEPMRRYIDAQTMAHIIGYVRGIDSEELKRLKDDGYDMTDIIGKSGIELAAEGYLKGRDGQRRVEEDIWGKKTDELESNPAVPGSDVVLTIDSKLQKVAMESLERNINRIRTIGGKNNFGDANAGAVVAIDVSNGEVLAMASYPSYDPSIFLESPDNKDAQKAIASLYDPKNEGKPAFNRAIQGMYAPGSTYKPLTSIAALQEGVITPDSIIYDSGTKDFGGMIFTCLEFRNGYGAHGPLNLERALATSCNIYFHEIGVRTGIDNITKWAKLFGLGEKTGIDVLGENKGILASREYKKAAFKDIWRTADTAQASIGQLYNSFTPLQLANYIATVANGGKRFIPHLIKRVVKYDGSIVTEAKPEFEQVPVNKENLNAVRNGMKAVVNSIEEGTAALAFQDFPQEYKPAGKTGTAETGNEANHSSNALFVCFAPAENPKIAVAVVVERGAWGANTAPIARDVLSAYFGVGTKSSIEDTIKPDEVVFTH